MNRFLNKFRINKEINRLEQIVTNIIDNYLNSVSLYPKLIQLAIICLEDKRFYKHRGYDLIAISRSAFRNLYKDQLSGASTIEQQLVRTLTKYKERTIKRKLIEIILAKKVSKKYSKSCILNCYLSKAYFGTNLTGAYKLSLFLFSKQISELSLKESFDVAACLKYPVPRKINQKWREKVRRRSKYGQQRYKTLSFKDPFI